MISMNNLKRQHEDVIEITQYINKQINDGKVIENASEIAKNISFLAGKLKIHLTEEDKSLYPNLLNSNDSKLIEFGKIYDKEMKDIYNLFMDYKNKYNTRTKILNSEKEFLNETKIILDILIKRINKEDKYLYPLL